MDNVLNYWVEAVHVALDDVGKLTMFSDEDIKKIAQNIQNSSEQQSMAFGWDLILNPLVDGIQKLKVKHECEIAQHERRDRIFRKNVADRNHVRIEDVYIQDERVVYDRIGL